MNPGMAERARLLSWLSSHVSPRWEWSGGDEESAWFSWNCIPWGQLSTLVGQIAGRIGRLGMPGEALRIDASPARGEPGAFLTITIGFTRPELNNRSLLALIEASRVESNETPGTWHGTDTRGAK